MRQTTRCLLFGVCFFGFGGNVLAQGLVGDWRNANPEGGLTRVVISVDDNAAWKIQAWRKCHPEDCDWGRIELQVFGDNVGDKEAKYGFAHWDHKFKDTYIIVRIEDKKLHVETFDIFKDESGRSNYRSTATLLLQAAAQQAAGQEEVASAPKDQPQPRTWTDRSGKQLWTATFVELKDGSVRLKSKTGVTFRVPLDFLSDADQVYIRKQTTADAQVQPQLRNWTYRTGIPLGMATFVELKDGSVELKKERGDTFRVPLTILSRADQEYVRQVVGDQPSTATDVPAELVQLQREVAEAWADFVRFCGRPDVWQYDNLRPTICRAVAPILPNPNFDPSKGPVMHLSPGSPRYREIVGEMMYLHSFYVSRKERLVEFRKKLETAASEGNMAPPPTNGKYQQEITKEIRRAEAELEQARANYARACAWAWPYINLRPMCRLPGFEADTILNPFIPVPKIKLSEASPDYKAIVVALTEWEPKVQKAAARLKELRNCTQQPENDNGAK
jgi:hypothetical protein